MKKSLGVICVFAVVLLGFVMASSASAQVAAAPDPALAAVFAGASLPQADLMPKPTLKCGVVCITQAMHTSSTISASGSTCKDAKISLDSQLTAVATNDCVNAHSAYGACNLLVHDMPCTPFGNTGYKIQGYITYACSINTC